MTAHQNRASAAGFSAWMETLAIRAVMPRGYSGLFGTCEWPTTLG